MRVFVTYAPLQIDDAIVVRECGEFGRGTGPPIDELHVLVGHASKQQFSTLMDALRSSGFITDDIQSTAAPSLHAVCKLPEAPEPVRHDHVAEPETAPALAPKTFSIPKLSALPKASTGVPNLFATRGMSEPASTTAAPMTASGAESSSNTPAGQRRHFRVEFKTCTLASLPVHVTFLMGPPSYFKALQTRAEEHGYVLTERSLRRANEDESSTKAHVVIDSEQALFDTIGVEWVPYSQRS